MRTTINLPDGLVEEAKACAARRGCTFTSLVAEGLSLLLHHEHQRSARPRRLPTYRGTSGEVLVELADKEAVAEALGDSDWP